MTHAPDILPTVKFTELLADPPWPSVTVTVASPTPPGLPKVIGGGAAPEPVLPAAFHAYVNESPSESVATAVKLNACRSAIPNVGLTETLVIDGL